MMNQLSIRSSWLLCSSLVAIGCYESRPPSSGYPAGGIVEMAIWADGARVERLQYHLEGPIDSLSEGVLDVPTSTRAIIHRRLGGVPVGGPYTVVVEGYRGSELEPACAGRSGVFFIARPAAGARAEVDLVCRVGDLEDPESDGSGASECPSVEIKLVVPARLKVGETAIVEAEVSGATSFLWFASSGRFADSNAAITEFTCSRPGRIEFTARAITAAEGNRPTCWQEDHIIIECRESERLRLDGGIDPDERW